MTQSNPASAGGAKGRELDIQKVKNMTQNEVQALVCFGLSEVCQSLGNEASQGYQREHFGRLSQEFEAFGRIFLAAENLETEQMRRKAKLINRTDILFERLKKIERELSE